MKETSSILTICQDQGGGEPISVSNIEETEDNFLWIQSSEKFIACFDKKQDKYLPIQWNDEIQPKDILQFYSTGNTLYAILSDGLYMLHVKSDGKMIQLTKNILLPDKKLNVILKGKDHILYLCNKNNQLIAYDTQSKKSSLIDCSDWGIHTNDIQNIYVHNGHLFACGQFEGIICYNLKEKHFRVIHISNNQADYKQPNIREICYLKDNRFAISNKRFIYEMKFDGENYLHSNVEIIRSCLLYTSPSPRD